MAPGGEVNVAAAIGFSGYAGEAVLDGEKVCLELIEFVLPALTVGPVAYQATSPGAVQTDLPLPGHLISPSPSLHLSSPTSTTLPFPSIYPVWSGSKDVTLQNEVSKCFFGIRWL